MKEKPILEKVVEKYLCDRAKKANWLPLKFTSPQRRSVPDRILLGSLEKVEAALDGYGVPTDVALEAMAATVTFIEVKRSGGVCTSGQEREHALLRARGFRVLVADNKEMIDELYDKEI